MKIKCRYIVCFLIILSIALCGKKNVMVLAAKTAKTVMSKESVTMYTNKTKQLKLKNVSSKVKWSSSNKQVARITNKRGKYQQIVTIKAADKAGKCEIKAKIKGKIYICKVTVKSDKELLKITLQDAQKMTADSNPELEAELAQKFGVTLSPEETEGMLEEQRRIAGCIAVKVIFMNNTSKMMETPRYNGTVEKFINGQWIDVTPEVSFAYTAERLFVLPGSKMEYTYNIAYAKEDEDNFRSGTYRLRLGYGFMKSQVSDYYVSFILE